MAAPSLICPEAPSDTGAYRIAWEADPGTAIRLDENGELLYQGTEAATTVSGRPAGEYVYRVGTLSDGGSPIWSDSCSVVVAPPSLGLAFSLFGLGLAVFAALLVVVVRGHRAHRRGELGGAPAAR